MRLFKYSLSFYLKNSTIRYYLRHPGELILSRFNTHKLKILKALGKDINFKKDIHSNIRLDIVIPTIDRDLEVLVHVIDSMRLNIKHPIGRIIIIGPNSGKIKNLCREKKCDFIFEDSVLPIKKKDINFSVGGLDRSGWIYQQLLKWSCDTYSNSNYFLIAESDTIFTRPQIFEYKKKKILTCSNQICHIPYWKMYRKLLGSDVKAIYNFTSHHLLFEKKKLQEFKKKIEKNCGMPWFKAVLENLDYKEGSPISDYETYGQYVYYHYKKDYVLENWFNLSLKRNELTNLEELVNMYGNYYKTISFHSYNL